MSLSNILLKEIQHNLFTPLDSIHDMLNRIRKSDGTRYKQSNAERVLRKLAEDNKVITDTNDKGYITGYRPYKEPVQDSLFPAPTEAETSKNIMNNWD